MEKYDPCGKYDYIYKVMVHNMNYVTKRADSDGTIDESSWGFGGYMAECGGRIINKKVSKGGQTTFWMDIHRRYPRAYIVRGSGPRFVKFSNDPNTNSECSNLLN